MSNTLRGLVPLIGFVVLNAATDVYAGNKTQSVSPITIAAVSFTIAAVIFVALNALVTRGLGAALRPARTHKYDTIMINVTTAVTWLTLLFSLKYLEPAVVSVVTFAIGPTLMVLIGPVLRRGTSVLKAEVVVSAVILVLICVLSWGSVSGLSSIGEVDRGQAILGLVLGVTCGLGYTATIVYSKRLSEAGLTPLSSMAVRYFLMVVVCWGLVSVADNPGVREALVPGAVVAVIGVGLTNYLGQVGIRYVEPITASLIDTLAPVVTFGIQLADGRLKPSGLTLSCVVGITVMVGVGVLARSRHERRTAAAPVEVPFAAAPEPQQHAA
jgi:drug/metabolite transporter (DMT)-like permease